MPRITGPTGSTFHNPGDVPARYVLALAMVETAPPLRSPPHD